MAKRIPGKPKKKLVRTSTSKKRSINYRWLIAGGVFLLCFFLFMFWLFGNITSFRSSKLYFYNASHISADAFADSLKSQGYIRSAKPLQWALDYEEVTRLKPGLYLIEEGRNAFGLASSLKSRGPMDDTEIEINCIRQRKNILPSLVKQTGLSLTLFKDLMKDPVFLDSLGDLNEENIWTIFVPGLYHVPKSMTEREVLETIYDEHLFYWNSERIHRANSAGLEPYEAMILASIVYSETKNIAEMPLISGVYINRLDKGMKLQADPTTLYAANAFTASRVREKHLKVDSKYNTYMYKGLPPGPICIPSLDALNAVLDHSDHDYLYFCAKDDFSGRMPSQKILKDIERMQTS